MRRMKTAAICVALTMTTVLTGIREIDKFAESISSLGREVVESSTRFLSIMEMVSVELAGYEIAGAGSRSFAGLLSGETG